MSFRLIASVASLLLPAAIWLASPALAETVKFAATLSGKSEVPPIASTASGSADLAFDTATRRLSWDIRFVGLSGPVRAAHFHGVATAAQNAPITLLIADKDAKSPLRGSKVLTPEQTSALMSGRWYINIHTDKFRPGEIRGQVVRR